MTVGGRWMLGGVSATIITANSLVAHAEAPAATAARTADSIVIEEIVVTAQKREQNLQSVPLSVRALTSAALHDAGVVSMQDVSVVPSLQVIENVGPISQSYHLRGIGSHATLPTFEPDVALLIDGVYMPRSGLGVDDLADLARIEILMGPQSTLYGKNATAGVINVVTKAPSRSFEATVEGSVSELDSSQAALAGRFAGSISGPFNDRLQARLSVVTYNQDDSYKNLEPGAPDTNNMNRYAVRGEIEADLWRDTTLRISALRTQVYDTRNGNPDLLYYAFAPPNAAAVLDFGPLGSAFHVTPCPNNNPNDRIICTSSPVRIPTSTNLASATLTSRIGRDTLTSITAWSSYLSHVVNADVAQVTLPVGTLDDAQRGNAFSEELRLTSPTGDRFEWLVGGYFQHTGFAEGNGGRSPMFVLGPAAAFIPLAPGFVLGQPGDQGFLNSKLRSTTYAVFAQGTFHFNEQFAFTVGIRGQEESKHAAIDNANSISPLTPLGVNLLTTTLTPSSVNAAFSHTTNIVNWNATGEYHPTQAIMVYLTVSHGGKSFGYNIGTGDAPDSTRPFKNEYVTNYELGTKATLWNGRAQITLAAFDAEYHNFQNAGFVGLQFLVDNARKVSVKGVEAASALAIDRSLSVNAGLAYIEARYDNYTGGACAFGEGPDNGGGGCVRSGRDLPFTPHWRLNLGGSYKHPLPFGTFYSRVDWTWQSSALTNVNLDPRSLQATYSLVNLRAGLETAGGWDISLWVKNLFDRAYSMEDGVSNLLGAGDPSFQRFLGPPREFGITLRKEFGRD